MANGGQPPTTDPHTLIKGLIEDNMATIGSWTPLVNSGWLEVKLQKTYQISIVASYGYIETANMTSDASQPRVVGEHFILTLFHPTRAGVWSLYRELAKVLNDTSLTTNGVNGDTEYQYIKIARSEETKATDTIDKVCGMDRKDGDCLGYRKDVTLLLVYHE